MTGSVHAAILRGAQERASPATTAKPLRGDGDDGVATIRPTDFNFKQR
jgi:hypothetical protein